MRCVAMNIEYFRGHPIKQRSDGAYIYVDTGELVAKVWADKPCGKCGLENTAEGYDGCIGEIVDAINACCGHGNVGEAYVPYADRRLIDGDHAPTTSEESGRQRDASDCLTQ